MTDKVSIIVPIYNIEGYIERCIKSLLKQTYRKIEILLINDGSTDMSQKICEKFVDNRRVFLINKNNGGLSDARNFGLKFAKGRYVVFIDGDDYVQPDYIEKLYESITQNHAQVSVCGYNDVTEDGEVLKVTQVNELKKQKVITGIELLRNFYRPGGVVNQVVWNKMFDLSLFSNVQFPKGRYYEDGFIIAPLFWNVERISIVRIPLYNYVQRDSSIMHTSLSTKKIQDSKDSYKFRLSFFKDKNIDLYQLAAKDYKGWIRKFVTDNPNISTELKEQLQTEYRRYYSIGQENDIKHKVMNWMANKDLSFMAKIRRLLS